jgi:hypothetical protein
VHRGRCVLVIQRPEQRKTCDAHTFSPLSAHALTEISNEQGEALLFSNRMQWSVVHDPDERLAERGVRVQQPDRIFGLSHTEPLKQLLWYRAGLRHSPFADGNVLYPFLIIEAKSEKGSPGFESIECQTAFPIRTLVKLQQDLSKVSEIGINPLVWFLANQGDEWRVYASIADGSKIVRCVF